MSNVCCKEFKGWCKAFTRTERLLTILEAALLAILIALLVFVIVHLLVCGEPRTPEKPGPSTPDHHQSSTTDTTQDTSTTAAYQTFPPDKECSWTPSSKTTAATHYFRTTVTAPETTTTTQYTRILDHTYNDTFDYNYNNTFDDLVKYSEQSDGEESPESYQRFILALVKIGPSETTFGCILTAVNLYWAVTSASCVQAIEVGDSLDAWWMVEGYGAAAGAVAAGRRHAVADVQEHPRWRGADAGSDLAALRAEGRLLADSAHALRLPTMLDYYLMTIGENLTVLGFGRFRTVEESRPGRRLRSARVWTLPPAQCAAAAAAAPAAAAAAPLWSARHLGRGRPLHTAPCDTHAGPLCCGVRYTRGMPCNYCAGTPLLGGGGGEGARAVLLGVMSDNRQCGETCEPQLYVNIAALRDWLDAVVAE